MSETLLSPSGIKLFGRPFQDISISADSLASLRRGALSPGDHQLLNRLRRELGEDKDTTSKDGDGNSLLSIFARIYSYSYEGNYFTLNRPMIFLVDGAGKAVGEEDQAGRAKLDVDKLGVASRDWEFASDIRRWDVNQLDLTLCINIESGSFEDLLLDATLPDDMDASFRQRMASFRQRMASSNSGSEGSRALMAERHRHK